MERERTDFKPKIVEQQKEFTARSGAYSRPLGDTPRKGWKIQDNIFLSERGFLYVGFDDEVVACQTGNETPYAFGVFGDVAIGDVIFIEDNPHQVGIRHFPLEHATPTNLYSNRHSSADLYGGASINLYSDEPDSKERGKVDSGFLNLIAYGRGSGPRANSIRFLTRDEPNEISEKMRVSGGGEVGIGTNTPQEMLDVKGNIRVGTGKSPGSLILYDED